MPSIAPRILDSSGSVIVDHLGRHIIALPAVAYTAPPPPDNVKYDVVSGVLTWDAVEGATGYKIYASNPNAADDEKMALVATVTALTWAASVLANADRRLYAVTTLEEYTNVESNLSKAVFSMGRDRRME